jgi:orotidine-5'-phosphate decarboxylase
MSQVERPSKHEEARERLIVALDVSTAQEARNIVGSLHGVVGMFKVGFQLFSAAGPEIARELVQQGERVFLDLKFHDIPTTVAAAGVEATRLGVSIFNVHAAGGREMMLRTSEAVNDVVAKERLTKPSVIAVTVLTSSNNVTLKETGIDSATDEQVKRLSLLAESAGMDGVVASPREVALVRSAVSREDFLLVTPGVRPAGSEPDDQRRIMSPREAMAAGSDYLVVGRPITAASDPVAAAQAIITDMAAGLNAAK